jgi:hypothetical protein
MKPIPNNLLKCMDKRDRYRLGKIGRTNEEIEIMVEAKTERYLQEQIANLLRQRGIWFGRAKLNKRSTYTPGAPDFLFMWNGRAYAFECKIAKGKLEEHQLICHEHMRRNGWLVFVVRSLKEAQEFLDGKLQVL